LERLDFVFNQGKYYNFRGPIPDSTNDLK